MHSTPSAVLASQALKNMDPDKLQESNACGTLQTRAPSQLDRWEELCSWAMLTWDIVDPQLRILCKGSEQVLDECGLPAGGQDMRWGLLAPAGPAQMSLKPAGGVANSHNLTASIARSTPGTQDRSGTTNDRRWWWTQAAVHAGLCPSWCT